MKQFLNIMYETIYQTSRHRLRAGHECRVSAHAAAASHPRRGERLRL
jgi:hypothetical protein